MIEARRSLPILAAAILLAVGASGWFEPASPVRAAGDVTALYIDGDSIRSLGRGQQFVFFGADADELRTSVWGATEEVRVEFDGGSLGGPIEHSTWSVELAAPPGETLTLGTYTDAIRPVERVAGQPGLSIGGSGSSCSDGGGEFTVHELVVDGGQLLSLSASFRQSCHWDGGAWVLGEVRYNSTSGFAAGSIDPFSIDFGEHSTGTSLPARTVTITSIGTRALELGNASIAGGDAVSFTLESDGCSNASLAPGQSCTMRVSARPLRLWTLAANLRAPDNTYRGKRVTQLALKGSGEVAGTADISPSTFYPHPDGYRDELVVSGSRQLPVRADIKVSSVDSDEVVAEGAIPMGTGSYRWTWDGDVVAGFRAPAGQYHVAVTITDDSPYSKTVDRYVRLSNDWLEWKTKTITKDGERYQLYAKSRNASVSRDRSAYPKGVRLTSSKGVAAVIYEFLAVAADARGWMTFEVQGKSPNKHKAVIAIHNPVLGKYRDLSHYDAARKVGPWLRWWKTGAPAAGRKDGRKYRATVIVWKGLGGAGSADFDIKRVTLTYTYGVLRSGPAPTSADGDAVPSARGRGATPTARSIAGARALPRLSVAPTPPPEEPPTGQEPVAPSEAVTSDAASGDAEEPSAAIQPPPDAPTASDADAAEAPGVIPEVSPSPEPVADESHASPGASVSSVAGTADEADV
jgi:hypothetical protein